MCEAAFSPSTRQRQRGNIETCLVLNKMGWRQCPEIVEQNIETSTAPWSAAKLWEWWRLRHPGSEPLRDCRDRVSQTRPSHPLNTPAPLPTRTTMTWTSQRSQKSHLSGPQLQAQLSRLTDLSRLRRLKDTLLSKGAWQQVIRIEDLCHAQVCHKWPYQLDACAGSVFTPHDYITNVQKRLGNRVLVGGGQCRCCGFFLDPQLEHAETSSNAEAMWEHYACVHAVVCGMKTGRPWHYHAIQAGRHFHYRCCPRTQRGPGRVRGFFHCSGSPRRCCTGGIQS